VVSVWTFFTLIAFACGIAAMLMELDHE